MIRAKDWQTRSSDESVTWSYTKFLIERIAPSDRLVIQSQQPLENFLVSEVIPPGYDFSPGDLPDFNHLLHVRPLTPDSVPINSKAVTAGLKHDLSKRGHYYEIYPEASISELDALVEKAKARVLDLVSIETDEDTLDHISGMRSIISYRKSRESGHPRTLSDSANSCVRRSIILKSRSVVTPVKDGICLCGL